MRDTNTNAALKLIETMPNATSADLRKGAEVWARVRDGKRALVWATAARIVESIS